MTTPLYGGSLVSTLPSSFKDVSLFRQVPDSQEVFVDETSADSMVFDLLEQQKGDIREASKVHLDEISSLNNVDGYKELSFEEVKITSLT
jgi:hypothetical protein